VPPDRALAIVNRGHLKLARPQLAILPLLLLCPLTRQRWPRSTTRWGWPRP